MQIVFAEIARRVLKDRILGLLCLLAIPMFSFLSLQLIYEQTEVSETHLRQRRESPHTEFNADVAWDDVQSVRKIERVVPGLFVPNSYNVGYAFTLKNGKSLQFPSNTVLTAAHAEIDRILAARKIPVITQRIPIPQQ